MKKILTFMLAVLLGGIALQAQETEIQPLVREGVVWHYCFFDARVADENHSNGLVDHKVFFSGDTLICGIMYKKCYIDTSESGEVNELPVAYAREDNGEVMFVVEEWLYGNIPNEFIATSLPGQYESQTGERIVYDFSDMDSFLSQCEVAGTIYSISAAQVGNDIVQQYDVANVYGPCRLVESVGIDNKYSGYLFMPFVERMTCYCSEVMGLIKLTDLDGNTLYKGTYYDDFNTDEPEDYQPLVREGVVWVNEHKIEWGDHTDCVIYRYEFSGDTIINGIEYKKCYRYKNQKLNSDIDDLYAVMREQGHKVYAIIIDDPIFGFFYRDENGNEVNDYQFEENHEALLFDFDDPDALYDDLYYPRIGLSRFVSGVGFDSKINGDAFHPFTGIETNQEYFETYGLRDVEDQNGNVIYKGYAYTEADINGDGTVDISDVNAVINMMLGKSDITPVDITGDGKVDISDVNAAINAMLGKE